MGGPELISPKQQPKLINASDLVSLLGHIGPTSNIRIRIHFKDNSIREGVAKWRDDRANGPAIVIPNKKNTYDEGVIPLGGQTLYDTPPRRISSADKVGTFPIVFGKIYSRKMPTNSDTDNMKFEVIQEK